MCNTLLSLSYWMVTKVEDLFIADVIQFNSITALLASQFHSWSPVRLVQYLCQICNFFSRRNILVSSGAVPAQQLEHFRPNNCNINNFFSLPTWSPLELLVWTSLCSLPHRNIRRKSMEVYFLSCRDNNDNWSSDLRSCLS